MQTAVSPRQQVLDHILGEALPSDVRAEPRLFACRRPRRLLFGKLAGGREIVLRV